MDRILLQSCYHEPVVRVRNMLGRRTDYPDNSAIFARKKEGRRERARASFAEKLAAVDDLRERVAPITRARESRKRASQSATAAQL